MHVCAAPVRERERERERAFVCVSTFTFKHPRGVLVDVPACG